MFDSFYYVLRGSDSSVRKAMYATRVNWSNHLNQPNPMNSLIWRQPIENQPTSDQPCIFWLGLQTQNKPAKPNHEQGDYYLWSLGRAGSIQCPIRH
jgi:hypothetical protein